MNEPTLGLGAAAANLDQPLREESQQPLGADTANPAAVENQPEGQPQGEPTEAQEPQARPLDEVFADDALYEDNGQYISGAELKRQRMMERDYRQKTMEAAEKRRQQSQQVETVVQSLTQNAEAVANRLQAEDQVLAKKVQQVQEAMQSTADPQTWQRLQSELQALSQRRGEVVQEYQYLDQQYKQSVQQARAAQINAAEGYLGATSWWTPEYHHGDLKKYALQQGYSEQTYNGLVDPTQIAMLHKARMYDAAQAKLKAAPKRQGKQLPASSSAPSMQGNASNEEKAALERYHKTESEADWFRWKRIANRNKRNAQR